MKFATGVVNFQGSILKHDSGVTIWKVGEIPQFFNMKKLKLTSISGNSSSAGHDGDPMASNTLYGMGFRSIANYQTRATKEEFDYNLFIGAYPKTGTEFFVYYGGPLGEVEGSGRFRLVRVENGVETELDSGTMSLGHYNQGTSPTYYGKGRELKSYSFHISFTEEEARQNSLVATHQLARGYEGARSNPFLLPYKNIRHLIGFTTSMSRILRVQFFTTINKKKKSL